MPAAPTPATPASAASPSGPDLPRWLGHRGAGRLAPENTLAAFVHGASLGCTAFECDVRLSADGVAYLMHDDHLDRTTSGQGDAAHWCWDDLARLDAGAWCGPRWRGEPLLRLDRLIDWLRAGGHRLDLELKPFPGQAERTGAAVAQLLQTRWPEAAASVLLSSFQPEALAAARAQAPELARALLLDRLAPGWVAQGRALGCTAVITQHRLMQADTLALARGEGWQALVYTVNERADAERLLALGVDGLITDAVDRLPQALPQDLDQIHHRVC